MGRRETSELACLQRQQAPGSRTKPRCGYAHGAGASTGRGGPARGLVV